MRKILCLDKWREPMENHQKSYVLNTSRYKWENYNLLTKHIFLYHSALTTRAEKSIPSSNLCPLWNNQSSQRFPNCNVKPTVSRSFIDAQHSHIFFYLRVVQHISINSNHFLDPRSALISNAKFFVVPMRAYFCRSGTDRLKNLGKTFLL